MPQPEHADLQNIALDKKHSDFHKCSLHGERETVSKKPLTLPLHNPNGGRRLGKIQGYFVESVIKTASSEGIADLYIEKCLV